MSIVINNNMGCGCGCGGGANSESQMPPEDYETEKPITGDVGTPYDEDGLAWKCSMSHYLIYALRLTLLRAVEWQGGYESWKAAWALLWSFYQDENARLFAYQPYAIILALLRGVSSSELITAVIDPAYNDLVCAIYSAKTSQEAAENVMVMLHDIFPDIILRQLATEVASQLPWDSPFAPQSLDTLPTTHRDRDCTNCAFDDFELPDDMGEGWHWEETIITAVNRDDSSGSTVTSSFNGNEVNVSADAGNGTSPASSGWDVTITYEYETPQTDQYMGMLMKFESVGSAGANTGGWLKVEQLLHGGDGSTGNQELPNDVLWTRFYAKNVNSGTPEHDVMSDIIASVDGGGFAGNANSILNYVLSLAYYHPWATVNNNITIRTWSLFWDGS